ncbi:hypothetical protein ACT02A_19480 [Klebsiella quasipneumoniae]|uniref:hypothetical protein n=1 Tax=Klebsiella pneumoniae complex TaxID=3390273 RepID=UPI00278B2A18|nr:hypothetical protein [Klebsiella variicola subsp. variicola]HCB4011296.1 hypothetical protein [Klebsiella variicola subsp. variicola]HDT1813233.1 hypothetical protein [Klebsiella variicola]
MGFYKTAQKAALDAWDNEIHQRAELKEKALEFAKKFGGKPVFCGDATDFRFHGLSFDAAPLIGHSSLWTLSRSQNGYTREPRGKSRIPRERRAEHLQLLDAWDEGRPTERISREPYWKALGLEWGMLILCGITHFRVGDVIYFKTSTTPSKGSGVIEIVESEFYDAEIALNLTGESHG